MTKAKQNLCITAIDDAISILIEMKSILNDGEADAPLGFLEAAHDAQERINRAVHEALIPLLKTD